MAVHNGKDDSATDGSKQTTTRAQKPCSINISSMESAREDSSSPPSSTTTPVSILTEAKLLFTIAIPTVAVQLFIFLMWTITASVIGRQLGTVELAGYSLATLTGNMMCLSVIIGSISASDTLSPRAYGSGDYEEVGKLAIRGFVVTFVFLMPVFIPLCFFMDPILKYLHQDPLPSNLASHYIQIYLFGVPFVLLFRVIQRFLAAQHIVMPLVYAAAIGTFIIHPVSLQILVPTLGFFGSGIAVVITQIAQAILALVYLKWKHPHHPRTWDGLAVLWSDALNWRKTVQFVRLSAGGVLSFSEWWFWETNCFLAGTFGVTSLCVHTIAYQLIPVCYMIPLGLSIALTVRMGAVIETDVPRAKRIATYCLAFTTLLGMAISVIVHLCRLSIVRLFTNDEQIIRDSEEIWHNVSIYITVLYMFGINSAILRALGLQWRMAYIIILTLWCIALPIIYYVSISQNGGLVALWNVLPLTYLVLNVNISLSYMCSDWYEISDNVKKRRTRESVRKKSQMFNEEMLDEGTCLLGDKKMRLSNGEGEKG